MTEVLTRPADARDSSGQRTAASSGYVWNVNLRPLVDSRAAWFDEIVQRTVSLCQSDLVVLTAAETLLRVLADSIWVGVGKPFVSSTDEGGITAEFDTPTVTMILDSDAAGDTTTYVALRGEWDWEGSLQDIPDGIEKWAWRLGAANNGLL